MTEQEAIYRLKDHMDVHKLNEPQAHYINIAHEMAIKALEKQIIKTPNEVTTSHGKSYQCSSCGRNQRKCIDAKYCIHCGQRFKT